MNEESAKALLLQYGKEISINENNIIRPSFAVNISIDLFLKFFKKLSDQQKSNELLGFVYNLYPYLSKNILKFNKNQLMELFSNIIKIMENFTQEIIISGVIEAVSVIMLYNMDNEYTIINQLLNSEKCSQKNLALLLVGIFREIPEAFFKANNIKLSKIIFDSISTGSDRYKMSLIFILPLLSITCEDVESMESIILKLWQVVFSLTESSPNLYQAILTALRKLSKTSPFFLRNDNPMISDIIQKIDKEDIQIEQILDILTIPSQYMSFYNSYDFNTLLHFIVSFLAQYMGETGTIHKGIYKALLGLNQDLTLENLKDIKQTCMEEAETFNYPSAVLILSIFAQYMGTDSDLVVQYCIIKIRDGFTSGYQLQTALFYSLLQLAPLVYENEAILEKIVISNLVSGICSSSYSIAHSATKLCKWFIENDIEFVCDSIPSIIQYAPYLSAETLPSFFKVLSDYVFPEDRADEIVEDISNYILSISQSESVSASIRALSLSVIVSACDEHQSIYDKIGQATLNSALTLLNTSDESCYKHAANAAAFFSDFDVGNSAYNRLLDLLRTFELKCRKCLFSKVTSFCIQNDKLDFPIDVFFEFFASKDPKLIRKAAECAANAAGALEETILGDVFSLIFDEARKSDDSRLVNAAFKLGRELVSISEKPPQIATELLWAGLEGRMEIFGQERPYTFNSPHFKLFWYATRYVSKYPDSGKAVGGLTARWARKVPRLVLPNLARLIEKCVPSISIDDATFAFDAFVDRAMEMQYNIDFVGPILDALVALIDHFKGLSLLSLVVLLEDLWDGNSDEENFVAVLCPIALHVLCRAGELQGTTDLVSRITRKVISGNYPIDDEEVAIGYLELLSAAPETMDVKLDCAAAFAFFLSSQADLPKGILDNIFGALRKLCRSDKKLGPRLIGIAEKRWPNHVDRVRLLTTASTRPTFK